MVDEKTAAENEEQIKDDNEPKSEKDQLVERMTNMAEAEVKSSKPKEDKQKMTEPDETGEADPEESDTDNLGDEEDTDGDQDDGISLDDELVERAVNSGISFSKLKGLSEKLDREELEEILFPADKKVADADSPNDEDSQEDKKNKAVEELMSKIPDIDDDWEDEVKEVITGLKDVIRSQAEMTYGLSSEIKRLMDGTQQSSEAMFIDGKVDTLGKSYEKLFGKGPSSMLSDRTAKVNREKLGRYLKFVNDEAQEAGEQITPDEAFNRALSGAFSGFVSKIKGAEAARKSKERSRKSIVAPKTRGGKFDGESNNSPRSKQNTDDEAFEVMQKTLREKQGLKI